MKSFKYFNESAPLKWKKEGYKSEADYRQDLFDFETKKKPPTRADFSGYEFHTVRDEKGARRVTQIKVLFSGVPIPVVEEGHEVDSYWKYPRK